jgi:Trypsin-like peptidase domain
MSPAIRSSTQPGRGALLAVSGLLAACGGGDPPGPPAVCRGDAAAIAPRTACGPNLELIPVNAYRGELSFIDDREGAVALIDGACTGTLIAASAGPVLLTAGHCGTVDQQALVAFNVEDDADGDPLVTQGTYFEQSSEPDYALLRLASLPTATPTPLTRLASARLAVIQHPRGRRKVVAEGDLVEVCEPLVAYADLDTLVGSSGAGVLNRQGYLVGVHTDGDCNERGGGANWGWTAASIVAASPYLDDGDLSER